MKTKQNSKKSSLAFLKYSDFHLQPIKSHHLIIKKRIKWICNNKLLVIPKEYITDGASVPQFLWSIFPPNRTDYLPCAIIHDWLCDLRKFREADKCFNKCLEHFGVSKFTRFLLVKSVEIYHRIRYFKEY